MTAASKKYAICKKYYLSGLWNADQLSTAVDKGWITEAEKDEILGLKGDAT